jgi:hypothetical protein
VPRHTQSNPLKKWPKKQALQAILKKKGPPEKRGRGQKRGEKDCKKSY